MHSSATRAKPIDRCAAVRELLPAYVEQELNEAAAGRVQAHLSSCAECRKEASRYRTALHALNARTPAQPGDLYPAFAARLARQSRPSPARRLRWAATCACAALTLAAGAFVLSSRAPRQVGPGPLIHAAVGAPQAPAPSAGVQLAQKPAADATTTNSEPPPAQDAVSPAASSADPSAQAQPSPTARRTKRHVHRAHIEPASFLDVVPRVGATARQQMEDRAHTAASPASAGSSGLPTATPNASHPGARPIRYVPAVDERIRVGDRVSRVKGEAGIDAQGRITVIRVTADTVEE